MDFTALGEDTGYLPPYIGCVFIRRPYNRPTSLVRVRDEHFVMRIEAENGERMATHLRPMTLRDALSGSRSRPMSR